MGSDERHTNRQCSWTTKCREATAKSFGCTRDWQNATESIIKEATSQKDFQILVTETSSKLCYFTLDWMQYIHYNSCSIGKYRNVEGSKCHKFGRLGISHFEKEGFCINHPKSWESFLHIPSPTRADLRFPLC